MPLALAMPLPGCEPEGPPDIAATRPCADEAFPMPNPASTGLPTPASYTVNADDTVTDNVTTLTWERTVRAVIYPPAPSGHASVPLNAYSQLEAARHCADLGPGWRLPTRLELVSLVDFTVNEPGPTIDQAAFPDTPVDFPYWTSSPDLGYSTAWSVDFSKGATVGRINVSDPAQDLYVPNQLVRCVRWTTPRCQPDRFQLQAYGLVNDTATGRTWQQSVTDGGSGLSWDAATASCAGLGDGWRLPSLTELQSIVDDTTRYPAIDTAVFPTDPADLFWTSSPELTIGGQGSIFAVFFGDGSTNANFWSNQGRVRCVR